MSNDSLGDRMKANYEDRARHYLTRRTPCIIRIDGKAFHTFTRRFERPFSTELSNAMNYAGAALAEEAQGFKLGFLQSDECSIMLTDYDNLNTEAWFDYNKSKIESVAASCFTAHFNMYLHTQGLGTQIPAMFDARAFSIPREEVANYFLWRAKDWERNSVSMYCQSMFSHKELHGQGRADQHEMLHGIGKNWATDLEPRWRNGTWLLRDETNLYPCHTIGPTFAEVNAIVDPLIKVQP